DRTPHIDDAEPVLQQLFRVGAEMVAHPARRRVHRMVVVHLPRGLGQALPRGVAHIVVEDEDAAGAQFGAQQALDLRVVDAPDLLGIVEIGDRGRRLDQRKAVAVERELRFTAARVLDRDVLRIVGAVPARHAGRRLDAVRGRLFAAAFEVMKRGGQAFWGYGDIERHDWAPLMLSKPGLIVACMALGSQFAAVASLSAVFVSKSLASWRSCNWLEGSPERRLTMRPRLTAGRSRSISAQRWTFLYSWTARNSAAPYWPNFASPPYQGKMAMSAIV